MTITVQPIRDLMAEAERKRDAAMDRVERAKAEAEKYAAEADAYRRALQALGFGDEKGAGSSADRVPSGSRQRKSRPPSKKWIDIYTSLFLSASSPYDYQAIMSAASATGHEITEGAMRTQMMNAVNNGLFERVDAGRFKFTSLGLGAIGAGPDENGETADSPEANTGSAGGTPGVLNLQPRLPGQ